MVRTLPILLIASAYLLAGCSDNPEISKTDEAQLRNNFSKPLSPEDQARMGGGSPSDKSPGGPPAAPEKKPK